MFSKNNTSWFRNIFVSALVSFTLAAPTLGDTYTQYTQSTIDDMTSETVATIPANRSRTTIGIGEEVECSIDSGTWEDKDCKNYTEIVWDTIGDRVWSCTSGGEISPSGVTQDDSTTLTADMSPGSVYVHVNVHDNFEEGEGYLYPDLPALAGRTFAIKAPSGATVSFCEDIGFGTLGTNYSGAKTSYDFSVTATHSVSFYNVIFREHFEPDTFPNFPDGGTHERGAADIGFTVNQANWRDDTIWDVIPIYYLYDGVKYCDYDFTEEWVDQYMNEDSDPVDFEDMTTTTEFYANGFECQQTYNGEYGGCQGPWESW